MSKATVIAELDGVTPGTVFVEANARINWGYKQIEGDILVADNGSQVVVAVRVDDSRLAKQACDGTLSVQPEYSQIRDGVIIVRKVWLTGDGGNAWADGQPRDELSPFCRYWQPRLLLASMGPANIIVPTGSRLPGNEICRLDLSGDIDSDNSSILVNKIRAAAGKTIDLQIHSDGGDNNGGWNIHNALAAHDRFVVANVAGNALSAAVLPLLAADSRTAQHDAQLMVHSPYITSLNSSAFKAGDLRRVARDLDNCVRRMAALIAARTNNDLDIVTEWIEAETRLNAAQALSTGFIHSILYDQAPRVPVARRARFAPINGPFTTARSST
jgi:ATP-dependent protease ClpP protease subunit